jgi:iduronate 2-sulfatase
MSVTKENGQMIRTKTAVVLGCVVLLILCRGASTYAEGLHKNVLLIIIDDLRPNLGCYGDPIAITPNINRLAASGTRFSAAYCQYPVCNPSRISFLTGMRPDTTGAYRNSDIFHRRFTDTLTLNRYVQQFGYEAIGLGKIYHASTGGKGAWTQPYLNSKWLDYASAENQRRVRERRRTSLRDAGLPYAEHEDVADNMYCDGAMADSAIERMEQLAQGGNPFLMIVGFRHPHLPWNAPKRYWDLYNGKDIQPAANDFFPKGAPAPALKPEGGELFGYAGLAPTPETLTEQEKRKLIRSYYACVSYADAQAGRLLDALESNQLEDNTLVILWGDHGYHLGENHVWAKEVNWERNHHAPLIIRAPGHGKPGQHTTALTEYVDIFPTVCTALGLPVPSQCEGQSLLPLLDNPATPWDTIAFNQYLRGNIMGRSIRTKRYRFTLWENENGALEGVELYDYQTDPQGNTNLAAEPRNAPLVATMTKRHREYWPAQRSHKTE